MKVLSNIGATLLGVVVIGVLVYLAWFLLCGYIIMFSSVPAEQLQSINSAWVYGSGSSQMDYFVYAHLVFVAFGAFLLGLIKKDWFMWHYRLKDLI